MRAARQPTSLTYEFVWCCAQVGDFSQHRACAGTPDACPAGCAELCWSCCFVWTLLQAEACALQQLIATAAWLKAGAVTTRAQHFVAKGRWCLLIPGQATRACSNQHDETKDSASVCSCCLGVSNSLSCTSTATWLMVMINSLNDSLLGGIGSRSSNTARLVNWLFGCPRKPAKSQLDFLSISPAIAPQPSPAAWISSCVNLVLLLLPVCCLHTRSPPPLQTAHLLQIQLVDSKVWLQRTQQQLVVSLFKHSVSPPAQESLDTRTKEIRCDTTSYMLLLFRGFHIHLRC